MTTITVDSTTGAVSGSLPVNTGPAGPTGPSGPAGAAGSQGVTGPAQPLLLPTFST